MDSPPEFGWTMDGPWIGHGTHMRHEDTKTPVRSRQIWTPAEAPQQRNNAARGGAPKRQRREHRSGLRPFVLFWPVEMGWSASCFWDRTAEWPHWILDWPLGGPVIGRHPAGKVRTQIVQSPLRWVLQSFYTGRARLGFWTVRIRPGTRSHGFRFGHSWSHVFPISTTKNWNVASLGSREAFPFPITDKRYTCQSEYSNANSTILPITPSDGP